MELKVWFDGLPRIVCGVNDKTTCQDIVFALAQATGKTGRFTLIERWRNNDRLLAPSEVVLKWGEHSSDVQYVLQCAAIDTKNGKVPVPSTSQAEALPKSSAIPVQAETPPLPPPYRPPPSPKRPKSPGKELPPYRLPPLPTPPQPNFTEQNTAGAEGLTLTSLVERNPSQQYKELIHLINRQREKLTAQQAELTKHDAEIMFWETKARIQERNMEAISKEIARLELLSLQNDAQVNALREFEEENDLLVVESEKLKGETDALKVDLSSYDQELNKSRNAIRLLEESLAGAHEIEKLRRAVAAAREDTDAISAVAGSLEAEFNSLETSLGLKKAEMDVLVSEMKEANLESLEMGEEDSLFKSRRRIRGSARQLKDAAPTTTNPHGVWV